MERETLLLELLDFDDFGVQGALKFSFLLLNLP